MTPPLLCTETTPNTGTPIAIQKNDKHNRAYLTGDLGLIENVLRLEKIEYRGDGCTRVAGAGRAGCWGRQENGDRTHGEGPQSPAPLGTGRSGAAGDPRPS
ncbi:hypothetical protein GCM10009642_53910 [Nocardiopsis metallicus]